MAQSRQFTKTICNISALPAVIAVIGKAEILSTLSSTSDNLVSFLLQEKDVEIFTVAVGPNIRENELLSIVSGKKERVFHVQDFHYLFNILADVLLDVCEGNTITS